MAEKNYYDVLGVAKDADLNTIKKAYRKLVRQYHPDVSKDPDAVKKTAEVNEAYEILKDQENAPSMMKCWPTLMVRLKALIRLVGVTHSAVKAVDFIVMNSIPTAMVLLDKLISILRIYLVHLVVLRKHVRVKPVQ